MTHLMVTFSWREGEDELSRRFLFVRISAALEFLRQHEQNMDKVRVDALRTTKDGEIPELKQIQEIWTDGQTFALITPDNDRLLEPPCASSSGDPLSLAWAQSTKHGQAGESDCVPPHACHIARPARGRTRC